MEGKAGSDGKYRAVIEALAEGIVLLDEIEPDAGKFIAEKGCAGQVQNGFRPRIAVDDFAVQIQQDDSVGQGFDHGPVFAVAVGFSFHASPFGIELINYMTGDG